MFVPTFSGKVENGKLKLWDADRERMIAFVKTLEGFPVILTVEKDTGKRTLAQNRYYWGVVLAVISESTGNSVQSLHEYFGQKYLGQLDTVMGKEIVVRKSTADLSTEEFGEYIDQIMSEVGEMGIEIPSPDGVVER